MSVCVCGEVLGKAQCGHGGKWVVLLKDKWLARDCVVTVIAVSIGLVLLRRVIGVQCGLVWGQRGVDGVRRLGCLVDMIEVQCSVIGIYCG